MAADKLHPAVQRQIIARGPVDVAVEQDAAEATAGVQHRPEFIKPHGQRVSMREEDRRCQQQQGDCQQQALLLRGVHCSSMPSARRRALVSNGLTSVLSKPDASICVRTSGSV